MITHKIFLSWLLYMVVTIFAAIGALSFGLPQLALQHDHVYLTALLLAVYFLAEILMAIQVVSISRQQRALDELLAWLRHHVLSDVAYSGDLEKVIFASGSERYKIDKSPFTDHIAALVDRSINEPKHRLDQTILLDTFADRMDRRVSIGEFLSGQIIWLGILATVAGVVVAFWPFMQAGATVDTMRNNLGPFFAGIAVAFIPCAVSFVFKILLNINSRILENGASELVEVATVVSESHVIPYLESR